MAEVLVFNGVDAVSGRYLLPAMAPAEISTVARRGLPETDDLKELRWWHHRVSEKSFGPKEGIDARQLSQAGWGVIFAHDADPAVREALGELLDHRRQAGQYYREFTGSSGYRPGMSKQEFLARQGAGPGPADPDVVPYYLLIVGDPGSVPYSFQYQLDVQYAVGRLHFDRLEDYASYARSVVAAETGQVLRQPRLQLFATHNPGDSATQLSSSRLVAPLAASLHDARPDWKVQACIGEDATKHALSELLRDASPPALLFTATHGIGFPAGHPRQRYEQGALLCQDWAGPTAGVGPLAADQYFAADDVGTATTAAGLIAFHFACFGAGTPQWDEFADGGRESRPRLAPDPFVAALPQRLLAHERGGALAVVGHVDRAWGYSFLWPEVGSQTEVFASCLRRLLTGHPVGSALEYFNLRYAELSSELSKELDDVRFGKRPDHAMLAKLWTANNDARNFAILGDPAVRLAVEPAFFEPPRSAPAEVPITVSDLPALPRPRPVPGDETRLPAPPPEPAEAEFGLFDGARQVRDRLAATLQAVAQNLGSALERAVDDVMVVEVTTYTSNDVSAIDYDRRTGRFTGDTTLRAVTRMGLGGDTKLLMPEQHDVVDQCVWTLHAAMVQEARQTRVEMIKAVGALVGHLVNGLKPT
jgi:hypothetical protein